MKRFIPKLAAESRLQSDGYSVYDGLDKVTNVGCFAHARRKFMAAKKLQGKGKTGKADIMLAKIQKLYALEAKIKHMPVQARYLARQNKQNHYLMRYILG